MNAELEERLVKNYPTLFAGVNKSEQESLMSFGCECGDGWFELISSLCREIQAHITSTRYTGPPYEFFQIKEKFGGLRVYDNGRDDYISGLINMAEAASYFTCEKCGNLGQSCKHKTGGTWYATLCPVCAAAIDYVPALAQPKT